MVLDQLVHDVDVLIDVFSVFVFLGHFPFEFYGHYVEYLRQFLPFLTNLEVNFIELTIMFPTVAQSSYCPPP